jgi:hypothetical protein
MSKGNSMKVFGFDRRPSPAQAARNEEVRFKKIQDTGPGGHEPVAMSDDYKLALVEQQAAIQTTPVYDRYGQVDRWKSLAKWKALPKTKALTADHLVSNYTALQHATALGDGWLTDEAHQRERQGGISNGIGIRGGMGAGQNTWPRSAADDTGAGYSNSNPLVENPALVGKRHPSLVTKSNIDALMTKFNLSFDAAATMLARGGN